MLKKLQEINGLISDAVPYVNWGGCAYYAALIQARLHELGLPTKTATIGFLNPPYGAIHILTVLELDGEEYWHDGEKTVPMEESPYSINLIDDDVIEVTNTNKWNEMFDPIEGVPMLCSIIEKVLGHYTQRPHFNNTLQGVHI